ncbi:phosphoadenosine phosphosulfate reductase domain-containing protein [Parasutterella muris]|uniref:phosphoadenosine phosphosulfate reductase domain-containing protein n=1 Tax=Parasutterella muris TaxID=2565572 RepID=UPI00203C4C59|nr:phosphoadenosine phosphosulfate reductase family protein [Parasutterella muris]
MRKIISVSGGKDSTAVALLAMEQNKPEDVIFVFCDTGNEHHLTYEYLNYLDDFFQSKGFSKIKRLKRDCTERLKRKAERLKDRPEIAKLIKPTGNPFLDICLVYGRFPDFNHRFCTKELKVKVFDDFVNQFLEKGESVESWTGVRADESVKRSKLPERELRKEHKKTGAQCWDIRPILTWTTEDVFKKIEESEIKANPLYEMGFSRVGCTPCILANKADLKLLSDLSQIEFYKIEMWEKYLQKGSANGTATYYYSKGHEGVWAKVLWANTYIKRGRPKKEAIDGGTRL